MNHLNLTTYGCHSSELLDYLLSPSADLTLTLSGLNWSKGYDWESLIPSINPMIYTMIGLIPTMHGNEMVNSKMVTTLLHHVYCIDYTPKNFPGT